MSESSTPPAALAPTPLRRELFELFASMRFSISLLTVICIASVIGTVVKQREPLNNYVNQFGPFWSEVYARLDIYTVYSAWWFLLILAFLVLSTSLCIARNTPKILQDLKTFKEGVREQSLQAHKHKALGEFNLGAEAALQRVSGVLAGLGWKARAQVRSNGIMIGARKGASNKIGYLAAHSSIVLICIGGLLDGDVLIKGLMWVQGKSVYQGSGLVSEVPQQNRLSSSNPSFRANLMVPEGARTATALIAMQDGVLLQDLPFDVELKKFHVEYYSTGMPKLFASDIVIRDHATGALREATVKVNEPVQHAGINIYQSSFEDGGSTLKLKALPLTGGPALTVAGKVGESASLQFGPQTLNIEISGLRVINVENLAGAKSTDATDVRKVNLVQSLQGHLGSSAKGGRDKGLQNVGPSFSYKSVDAAGQRREFNNYMQPVNIDGQRVFLLGMRDNLVDEFRYLRVPADAQDSLDAWLQLKQALAQASSRDEAARRYAALASPADKPQMRPQLQATAKRALALFAGAERVRPEDKPEPGPWGGLMALSQFVEREVPEAERSRVSEVLLRILNGSLYELHKMTQEQAGQPAPKGDAATQAFMTQAVLALSDAVFYPSPVILQLDEFQHVQASVFQLARAPGQSLVYIGAVLLIIGVFAMLYIKERRLWIWLEPAPQSDHTRMRMALSSTRESPDTAQEFEAIKQAFFKETA